ncbi:AI-2E family transporter [Micromonospora sp. CPCC 206060]|uniref:AI-2E family transporter n=1 Tax=Micromonospora sp. CPCC 206060 TaxID=3122406 RepID=UPI002FF1B713
MTGWADDRTTARRVAITIGLVLATALGLLLLYATHRVLVWLLVALFFAVALNPAVDWTQRRLARNRSVATLLVFLAAFGLIAALIAVIVVPLIDETARFTNQLPAILDEARAGQGPLGSLLERTGLLRYAETHQEQIQQYGAKLREPTLDIVRGAFTAVAGLVTVAVLAYLMVLQAPKLTRGMASLVNDRHAERLRRVGRESARTVTGYLSGNLLISVICGGLTFVVLVIMGVPFAGVIALLVGIADLVPLVGATIGAIVAAGAAFLHSPRAGIVVLVFFVVYQQVENHVLQPLILSRTVQLNPLTVLVSILLAADLAGILGALLAIPAAGIIQILLREFGIRRRVRALDGTAPGAGTE